MVPNAGSGESLGLSFTEHLCMSFVFLRQGRFRLRLVLFGELGCPGLFRRPLGKRYECHVDWSVHGSSWNVHLSWDEACLCGVFRTEDHRELIRRDPSSCPIYVRLDGCKPWVAEDKVSFSNVGEEEPEQHLGYAMLYTDVGVVSNISLGVGSSIDVDDLPRSFECLDWELHSSCVVHMHKVFGCPAVQ